MQKLLLLEEYHLSLRVPTSATDAECDTIRKILTEDLSKAAAQSSVLSNKG